MITLPAKKGLNYGLSLVRGNYRARFYEDGKMRVKALGTRDLETARASRDHFYAELQKQGAIFTRDMARVSETQFIYRQPPFFVKIGRKHIGGFNSFEEAQSARDAALAELREKQGIEEPEEEEEFTI